MLATQMAGQLQATNAVRYKNVTATAEAYQDILNTAKSWPIVISEPFDEDNDIWVTGENESGEFATISWAIKDGKYEWKADAKDGFVWWVLPESEDVTDFYISADVQFIDGPPDAEAGLVFRHDGDENYYDFSISNDGKYSLYLHNSDGWEPILDWTPSIHLIAGDVNNLAVISVNDHLVIFINNQYQTELPEHRLIFGRAGLIISLSYSGDRGTWQFDNFELHGILDDGNEQAKVLP